MRQISTLLSYVLLATSGLLISATPSKACQADNKNYVRGNDLCLAIETYKGSKAGSDTTLVVTLHGDVSSGGPADYLDRHLETFIRLLQNQNVVGINLLRPGYYDSNGKKSSGYDYDRKDSYTPKYVDAIAKALGTLKSHYRAKKVVVMGHSGGAGIAAVILGRRPGIVNAVVLAACPCDIEAWRDHRGSEWSRSLSASDFVEKVPTDTRVVAITGEDDENTLPKFAKEYIRKLKSRGVNATFLSIQGARHGFRQLRQDVFQNLGDLLGSPKDVNKHSRKKVGKHSGIPEVRAGSATYQVARGQKVIIYGIKNRGCESSPPSFEKALKRVARGGGTLTNPKGGTLYDAGIAQYRSRRCGVWVLARAIGFKAGSNFTGDVELKFGRNTVNITVQ